MKRFLLVALAVCGTWGLLGAQQRYEVAKAPSGISKPLDMPLQWLDNSTVQMRGGDGTFYTYQVRSGVKTPSEAVTPKGMGSIGERYGTRLVGQDLKLYNLPEDALNPFLSPNNKYVAYTLHNDLYAKEVETGRVIRYTYDGSETILNGYASWVYYEEILGRPSQYCAFWWSPNSETLCFFRSDESHVPMFPIYVSEGAHGYIERTRYPKTGDENPQVKIGLVAVDGEQPIVWAQFDPTQDQYFGTPYWTPTSDKIWIQWMNRAQNHLIVYSVEVATGAKEQVYEEKQDAWLDWIESPTFVDGGLLMVRDFEKWQQVYLCPWDGSGIVPLTKGHNWGVTIVAVNGQTMYYTARLENSTRVDLYSAALPKMRKGGSGASSGASSGARTHKVVTRRLTQGDYHFSRPLFSPNYEYFTITYQNVSTPPRLALYSVKKGFIRDIDNSCGPDFERAMASGELPQSTLHFITTDGFTIPAVITWPLHMEEGRKYPMIIDIYGGPDAGTVMDSWKYISDEVYHWAKEGVIQINMDHRGSGHCGKLGLDALFKNLGYWEMHDYKLWVDYVDAMGCLDRNKVGITGFSYGGYITAYAVTTCGDYFPYGIAGAGVHDWTLYDTHYGERFMLRPQDNPEGYKTSSVIRNCHTYASFGKPSVLYINHGTSDDNVHYQNSVQLVNELMKTNKHFEFMIYPSGRHGYRGEQSRFFNAENVAFWMRYLLDK